MRKLVLLLVLMVPLIVQAAAPAYTSFNTFQFATNGNRIAIKSTALDDLVDMGTVANGGTLTLLITTNFYKAAFSGATATIALPAITSLTNSHSKTVYGTNTSNGSQIIAIPPMIREELNPTNQITSFTNNMGASWTFTAVSVGGAWNRAYIAGDALTFSGGGAFVGAVSNNVASAGLLAVDATKTNGIAATLAHMTNALALTGSSSTFLRSDGTQTIPPGNGGTGATWDTVNMILSITAVATVSWDTTTMFLVLTF